MDTNKKTYFNLGKENHVSEDHIKKVAAINQFNQFSLLKSYLAQHRCLIILDDVQEIFSEGKVAGNYQLGYENYGKLFKLITRFTHQSCLILVSQELPWEIANLAKYNPGYSSLILTGLKNEAAREILHQQELLDEERWEELINIYEGHPFFYKSLLE